jgi:hypothetical protein
MLTRDQVSLIEQVLSRKVKPQERLPFGTFIRHINTVMLDAERADMESAKAWLFEHSSKYPNGRVRLEAYNQVKGELEFLQECILEAAGKGKVDVAWVLIFRLLGTYWERVFCRRFGIETKELGRIHRPQKWHPLGAPGLALGGDQAGKGRITLPDVMLMYGGHLVFAEIKHETLTTGVHGSVGAGCYGLPKSDWWRIEQLLQLKPAVPYWFIIHEHKRLGRWNIIDDPRDWLVGDFRALDKPQSSQSLSAGTTDHSGAFARNICYWQFKDKEFIGLTKALEGLGNETC